MPDASPRLRHHLLHPSGGLVYLLRALRYRNRLWAPFHAQVAAWLEGWNPGHDRLILIGPNAGHALPPGFLDRFQQVVALEPDPLARLGLRRRTPGTRLSFSSLDCLADDHGLARLARAYPDSAILFCNVLGQVDAPGGRWSDLILHHLSGHAWGSYHDVISTRRQPERQASAHALRPERLEATLSRFWSGGELAVVDHGTHCLGEQGPFSYALWQITPKDWHLVEWACQAAMKRPAGATGG
ncbi:hypothetical protein [Zoogloea sp.]|uniref:hypothetical protein n=1 Tax=Zoogloea sp. TaxID=49181 RepID=UPI0026154D42|nr:hypothetical protein [Zoogloea sp.]MDD3354654.1 hypothetical protein [Zoogloea sp.]